MPSDRGHPDPRWPYGSRDVNRTKPCRTSIEKLLTCRLVDRFNPLSAPRPRLERVTEVLRLAKDLPIPELHDTDSVGRLPIIADDIFGNPNIAAPKHTPNGEVLVGQQPSRRPDGEPATDALA